MSRLTFEAKRTFHISSRSRQNEGHVAVAMTTTLVRRQQIDIKQACIEHAAAATAAATSSIAARFAAGQLTFERAHTGTLTASVLNAVMVTGTIQRFMKEPQDLKNNQASL